MKMLFQYFAFILCILHCIFHAEGADDILTKEIFEQMIKQWKESIPISVRIYSNPAPYTKTPEFLAISRYHIQTLPFFVEGMKKEGRNLYGAVFRNVLKQISKKIFEENVIEISRKTDYTLFDDYIKWWDEGADKDIETFLQYYSELKQSQTTKHRNELIIKIQNLGIRILPSVLEKIQNGDDEIVPVFDYLTNSKYKEIQVRENYPVTSTRLAIQEWWEQNKLFWELPKEGIENK